MIDQLVQGEEFSKLRVRSVAIAAACTNCGIVRNASVSPAQVRDAQRRGLQPETECRRCSASVPVNVPHAVSTYFLGDSAASTPSKAEGSGPLGIAPQWWALFGGLLIVFIALAILLLKK